MTTFTPVREPVRRTQRSSLDPVVVRSTRILLVEDEPLTAEVFERALSRDGHEVDVARDGLQALRRLREHTPHLVVLDMSLPALSGPSVVRELRAHARRDLPIVVVSGSDRRLTTLTDDELRPGTWLVKPIKPRELVRIVDELLAATPPHED